MADKCHLCLLGLIFLSSSLTGSSRVIETHVFISSGENVYLPCINALPGCKSTVWYYNNISASVGLISLGEKKTDIERHERLSLGSDCSLNIRNITKEDYGCYTCLQYVNNKLQGSVAHVFLHVLHMSSSSSQTEISAGRSVTLSCQLYSYSFDGVSCDDLISSERIELVWVNQTGVNMTISDSGYQTSASRLCIITLNTTVLIEDSNREWRCAVTHRNQVKTSVTYTVKSSGSSGVIETQVFISSGENVYLPCNNALPGCKSTVWYYNNISGAAELIGLGEKKTDIERHERLSLGSDCSLNIKNVTKEDYGRYTCLQYVNNILQGSGARVFLHVLHVSSSSSQTEISAGRSVTLSCQLYSYSFSGVSCDDLISSERIELLWVNQTGVSLTISDSAYLTPFSRLCIITLNTTILIEDSNREWRCAVTHRNQVKSTASYTVKSSDPAETEVSRTAVSLLRVIMIIVEIAVFVAPTVILLQIVCAGNKEKTLTTLEKSR